MQVKVFVFVLFFSARAFAQPSADTISPVLVQKHVSFLAADSLKGRGNYTPQLYTAAHYIAEVFKQSGLTTLPPLTSYFQPFTTQSTSRKKRAADSTGAYNPKHVLLNVIGVLPGKSKAQEAILFTAHYDHLGGSATLIGDGIYNGANDNASGTAAVLALAHYYALRNNNERTLIFCTLAGEELGLWGARALVPLLKADAVKAVINIEMIGKGGAAGSNSLFITGSQYSSVAAIFKWNIKSLGVAIVPEPGAEKNLFRRSDNYPFALKGIPAHSFMSSDDGDACYHLPCDDLKGIDTNNMTNIIKAIAAGSQSLIDGTDTPERIKPGRID